MSIPIREKTKLITVGEETYEIRKLDARSASWILMIVSSKMLPAPVEQQFTGAPSGRTAASKEEFDAIQAMCLSAVSRVIAGSPLPIAIFSLPLNKFTFDDLNYDLETVVTLTAATLAFNLAPFFAGGGLPGLLQTLEELMPKPQGPNKPGIAMMEPNPVNPTGTAG